MSAIREHRVTHPILGIATWRAIQDAAAAIKRETGRAVCSWCHGAVPTGLRKRCGKAACAESIWRAYSWEHCARVCIRGIKTCSLCGSRYPSEVDHIVPVSMGGTSDLENLRPLCQDCHRQETARLRAEKTCYVARVPDQHATKDAPK